jgi:hypothetical protein
MYPSRIRLSTSSLELFHTCERKWQLIDLLRGNESESNNSIFTFGRVWGEGIMEYLVTQDLDAAVYHAWKCYYPQLEDDVRTEELLFQGLRVAKETLDMILQEWHVYVLPDGTLGREIGFHLDINERFFFQSAMDGILEHNTTGGLMLLENKHTLSWLDDITPMYKNSGQGTGYSIVLDEIAKQMLGVYPTSYLIGQFKKPDFHKPLIQFYPWKKTLLERLNWFVTLGMDVDKMQQMLDMNIFPMRGHSCMRFNRPCQFFGTCQLRANDHPKDDEWVEKTKTQHVRDIEASIKFRFKLDDIVTAHLQRVQEELGK